MIRGLYTAASGMISTMVQTDTMANNLANVNTVGFKKNGVNFRSFPEVLLQRIDANGVQPIGSVMTGSRVQSTAIDFNQGAVHRTGNPLDVAIQGKGFLMVQDGQGNPFLTRNGSMTLNENGNLVTQEGFLVMDETNTPINFPPNQTAPITIGETGMITQNGNIVANLQIVQVKDLATLEKVGDHHYRATDPDQLSIGADTTDSLGTKVFQYTLEMSNVNVVGELVNNITGMRLYESLQKNIQMQNSTLEKLVNEVGRARG